MNKLTKRISVLLLILTLTGCMGGCDSMVRTGQGTKDACECSEEGNKVANLLKVPDSINEAFKIPNYSAVLHPFASAAASTGKLGPVSWLVDVVTTSMRGTGVDPGGAQLVYEGLNGATFGWSAILKSLIMLSIMFYGASLALGLVQANPYSVIIYIIKIAAVYWLATDWGVFEDFVVNSVEALVEGLTAVMSSTFSGSVGSVGAIFDRVDRILFMFMAGDYWKVLMATVLLSWNGIIYALCLIGVIITYMWGLIGALKVYVISIIARNLMYAVAPLYLTFLLFEKTKSLFDAWVEQIVNFTLQPIFLFAFFGMFNEMIINFLTNIAGPNANVCMKPILEIGRFLEFYAWQFEIDGGSDLGNGPDGKVPLDWWGLMALLVLSKMMGEMATWVQTLAQTMSGGLVSANAPLSGWESAKQRFKGNVAADMKYTIGGLFRPVGGALGMSKNAYGQRRFGFAGISAANANALNAHRTGRMNAENIMRKEMGLTLFDEDSWRARNQSSRSSQPPPAPRPGRRPPRSQSGGRGNQQASSRASSARRDGGGSAGGDGGNSTRRT